MEYLGDAPEKRDRMEAAWKASWYILARSGCRPDFRRPQQVCPPDPEAEYERLYRKGEIEIIIEPEPWESEDEWTKGYIKLRQELLDFHPYSEKENKNGIT